MSNRTYVVTKDTDGMGRETVVYAGDNANEAKRVRDAEFEPSKGFGHPTLETFIEVWRDGERKFVTREHPLKV